MTKPVTVVIGSPAHITATGYRVKIELNEQICLTKPVCKASPNYICSSPCSQQQIPDHSCSQWSVTDHHYSQ